MVISAVADKILNPLSDRCPSTKPLTPSKSDNSPVCERSRLLSMAVRVLKPFRTPSTLTTETVTKSNSAENPSALSHCPPSGIPIIAPSATKNKA